MRRVSNGILAAAAVLAACGAPEPPVSGLGQPGIPAQVSDPRASDITPLQEPLMPLEDLPTDEPSRRSKLVFPYLDGEREDVSVSIGDTTHGRLVNGKELFESTALKILPRQKERDLKYGTDNLVALLDHAGRALFDKTKTTLWVGNLGKREGGDIEWSVSHNAGRDADVAFCYRDAKTGAVVDPPDLVQVTKEGIAREKGLVFDTARTWTVIRSMLEFSGASIQYLFISDGLKKKLLEHARLAKEPPAIIERAAEILRQPGSAAPHDDHLHVRVYCSAMDVAGGCRDMGFVHSYAKRHDEERAKAADRARKQLAHADPNKRRNALLRLGLVGDARDIETGITQLASNEPAVRSAAAEMVAALGTEQETPALVARFREEDDAATMAALVEGIGFLGGKDAGPFFRDVLLATASAPVLGYSHRSLPLDTASMGMFLGLATDPYPPMRSLLAPTPLEDLVFDRRELQRLAVRAVRHSATVEPIEPLVELLTPADPKLALDAAESLAFLTNQRFLDLTESRPLVDRLGEAKFRYGKLVAIFGKSARDGLLLNGFAARGYKVKSLEPKSSWELLRAVADEPHVSYNARSVLVKLFGQPKEVLHYGAGDGCRWLYSLAWERRGALHLEKPTEAQAAACAKARAAEKSSGLD